MQSLLLFTQIHRYQYGKRSNGITRNRERKYNKSEFMKFVLNHNMHALCECIVPTYSIIGFVCLFFTEYLNGLHQGDLLSVIKKCSRSLTKQQQHHQLLSQLRKISHVVRIVGNIKTYARITQTKKIRLKIKLLFLSWKKSDRKNPLGKNRVFSRRFP